MSQFYLQLDDIGQKRYKEKLLQLGLKEDPYLLPVHEWSANRALWPSVEFPDIYVYMYLIDSPSPHTKEALKAYKSTEAWSFLADLVICSPQGLNIERIVASLRRFLH
jgi:hypothetical protein